MDDADNHQEGTDGNGDDANVEPLPAAPIAMQRPVPCKQTACH